jgi:uncharacterized protein with ParB-like and HNH nuclease domain
MAYQSTSIASVVRKLNRDYYLPAIQRPYVWQTDQIIRLFDSLMKGFPISSFLFWDIDPSKVENLAIYKFIEDFQYGDFHNEIASITDRNIVLVLDGQQRLTSLLIGLLGSYKVKDKYRRHGNPDAWKRNTLYLDLLKEPDQSEELLTEVTYGFRFFSETPRNDNDHYWFPVKGILDFLDRDEFNKYLDDFEEKLEDTNFQRADRKIAERNLERLYDVVWKEEAISFFMETSLSLERVLDIFVRANDGGTKLSKSDLMLATMTTMWGDMNARDEIYNFVDYINKELPRKNAFDKDWVMKACLVLTDLPNAYKISSFTGENLTIIRNAWDDIKSALETTVRLINDYGVDRDSLTSTNALMPIAYYLYKTGIRYSDTTVLAANNLPKAYSWLLKALLGKTFGGSSDNTISLSRSIIKESLAESEGFPEQNLLIGLKKHSQLDFTDSSVLSELLDIGYKDSSCFLALSLLYDDKRWGTSNYHIDHIFPQKDLSEAKLLTTGVSELAVHSYLEAKDKLANLELLPKKDNLSKSAMPFYEWLQGRDTDYRDMHFIPTDSSLYNTERFLEFSSARNELLRERFETVLGVSAQSELGDDNPK